MNTIDLKALDDTMYQYCYASVKDFLIDKYYRRGESPPDICHRTGWSESFFLQLMRQLNLPIREEDRYACQKCKD